MPVLRVRLFQTWQTWMPGAPRPAFRTWENSMPATYQHRCVLKGHGFSRAAYAPKPAGLSASFLSSPFAAPLPLTHSKHAEKSGRRFADHFPPFTYPRTIGKMAAASIPPLSESQQNTLPERSRNCAIRARHSVHFHALRKTLPSGDLAKNVPKHTRIQHSENRQLIQNQKKCPVSLQLELRPGIREKRLPEHRDPSHPDRRKIYGERVPDSDSLPRARRLHALPARARAHLPSGISSRALSTSGATSPLLSCSICASAKR